VAEQTASIVVTDIVGSTSLRERIGEDDADSLRRVHDRLLGDVVAQHGGAVVKGLGDGVLAMFPGAAGALAACGRSRGHRRSLVSTRRVAGMHCMMVT
jgi:class 3 adenylate cyclase